MPHLDRRQHVVPAARRGEVEGRRDLAQVVQHRLLALRDVDREVQRHAGADGHREVADPGHRQVGEDLLAEAEGAGAIGVAHAGEHVAMAQHTPFGLPVVPEEWMKTAGPSGCGAHDQRVAQRRLAREPLGAARDQPVPGHEARHRG